MRADSGAILRPRRIRALSRVAHTLGAVPFFKMYATYCGKFTDAPARLAEAVKRSRAVEGIASRAASEFNTALEALLFRPVQRMCVYPLLFSQARPSPGEPCLLRARARMRHAAQAAIM